MRTRRKEIKKLCIDHDWTQEQLAEILGCSRQTLNMIIMGKTGGTQKFWDNFKKKLNIPDEEIEKYRKMD